MVSPLRHVGDIEALSMDERDEIMDLSIKSLAVLKDAFEPHGFNIGANLGEAAGAGIPGHFHMHVVPRWTGDTNFMPVLGDAKVLPEPLSDTYRRLKPFFEDLDRTAQ
jgi:ATP adenylyltransferase